MSINRPTIEHLRIACRHVNELIEAGVTENHAIRTLELFSDAYAKSWNGGSVSPHHVDQVKLWSLAALKVRNENPDAKPKDYFRVEHGTPRRAFARKVMALHKINNLTEATMSDLVQKFWRLAVITLEEDAQLNKVARSKEAATPEERWALAGILF